MKTAIADRLVDKIIERMIEDNVRLMLVDNDPTNMPAIKFFNRKFYDFSCKRRVL
ncbi:hypothetical protein OA858_02510 [Pseudanabaena galeata CCNP1313]|nr:hypothetical protein [Pseudanabaena galeata]WGS72918.1 hypothetical protein OA858_02510 [Pseudanabaena galeata CCNP1313]